MLVNGMGWALPVGLFRPIDLLADLAIPGMLVLLGIQLSSAPLVARQAVLARVVALRLLGTPLLAFLLCWVMGFTGMERNVILLQSAMPTAVITTVLATEYDAAPRFVATVIFFTTLVSMVTLSLLLSQIL
jgi:predicted permease